LKVAATFLQRRATVYPGPASRDEGNVMSKFFAAVVLWKWVLLVLVVCVIVGLYLWTRTP
jgi:hypothetical protein